MSDRAALIRKRKSEHLKVCLSKRIESGVSNGFERVRFANEAAPELDWADLNTRTEFLGHKLAAPFMITAVTGGCVEARKINADFAKACEVEGVALGLGSQRPMFEGVLDGFDARKHAPTAFIAGNLGATQLRDHGIREASRLVREAQVDALCVHFNPLQDAVQKDGDRKWRGCLDALRDACADVGVPVIAKEVGAGISFSTAKKFADAGVAAIDVAGVGGSSWSLVEKMRSGSPEAEAYADWGLPTAEALVQCSEAVRLPLIASGGMRSGLDVAKAVRLGATLGGAALPFLRAQKAGRVQAEMARWKKELEIAMFCTGSRDLRALRSAELLR
ncbi:MAG: type 2 isopentenyl-diphosphate Delta-isomerase [Candidatus Micrarchaeia archaeon]